MVFCCKPFPGVKCSRNSDNLKPSDIIKLEKLNIKSSGCARICHSCRIRLCTMHLDQIIEVQPSTSTGFLASPVTSSETQSSSNSDVRKDPDLDKMVNEEIIKTINTITPMLGTSPYNRSKAVKSKKYASDKTDAIVTGIKRALQEESSESDSDDDGKKKIYFTEMMENMKDKFNKADYNQRLFILSLLPYSMKAAEIQKEFGTSVTSYMIQIVKESRKSQTILYDRITYPKRSSAINEDIIKQVIDFYEDDDITRVMPGKRDCIVVTIAGEKKTMQKRLMMNTINEAYAEFKARYPQIKLGFTKFGELRPKYCIKLGDATHNVCVCSIHQNVKLMFQDAKISILCEEFTNYKDFIKYVLCKEADSNCYMLKCDKCPGLDVLTEKIKLIFEKARILEIRYKQWNTTDRCNLDNLVDTAEDFIKKFITKIKTLIPHHFLSKQQAMFIKITKENLEIGEFLVMLDFAENYSFVVQNAVQGFHWNNNQATIHPFTIYYKDSNNILQHLSYVNISECLIHNAVAVHVFKTKMINYLKSKFNFISKIIYISDGAASQYKNRYNFINILKHKEQYDIDCEWHFHATSHGKGPCDGIGGTIKRGAYKASLANEDVQITSAFQLYNWAKNWSTSIEFGYSTNDDHQTMEKDLAHNFSISKRIIGTQSYHAYIPCSDDEIKVKLYSNSKQFLVHKIC